MGGPAPADKAAPSLAAASAEGLCPRCGAKTLFGGVVQFAPSCSVCGLDFSRFNVGDGPAAFLILIIGALLCIGAIWLELAAEPAWWVHLVWVPIGLGLTLAGLRFGKASLLYQEYHQQAEEGRLRK